MRLYADESVDQPIVDRLRSEGHQVIYAAEEGPGQPDDAVLAAAEGERAVLVTADKDFGELVFRQKRITTGVLLIRLAGLSPQTKARLVCGAVRQHDEEMSGAFSVITPAAIRIRSEPLGDMEGPEDGP